jgi:hypothetical protein
MTENGTSSSDIPESNWTKEQLTGGHDAATLAKLKKADPSVWGRPGYLALDEYNCFVSRNENVPFLVSLMECHCWESCERTKNGEHKLESVGRVGKTKNNSGSILKHDTSFLTANKLSR